MSEAPHPIDVLVGRRLRTRRKDVDMSQTALGEALGLTFQQVQKYERGVNRISASKLYEAARVLGVPVSWFFEGGEDDPAAEAAPGASERRHDISSRELQMVVDAFRTVSDPNVRRCVLALVAALAAHDRR